MKGQIEAKIIGVEKGCPEVGFRFNGNIYKKTIPKQASMSKVTKNFNTEPACVISFSFNPKKPRRRRFSKMKIIYLLQKPHEHRRHRHIH